MLPSPAQTVPPATDPPAAAQQHAPSAPELADPLADPATAPVTPASGQHKPRHAPGDPFENVNRYTYRQQMKFDRAVIRPAALGYKHVVPGPVRRGLRHFFTNLKEPAIFINYLLQLKPGKAAETATRFLFNSTLGLGGFFDVAREPNINLPHRPNGFGDTLGFYGVKPGPYIFLPLLGPTTLRDMVGGGAESLVLPKLSVSPFDTPEYQVTRGVTEGLDTRAQADEDLRALLRDAVDPYATFRSAFLQNRAGEIEALHGHKPAVAAGTAEELSDPLADPAGGGVLPARPAPAAGAPTPPAPASAPKSDPGTPELADPLADPATQP